MEVHPEKTSFPTHFPHPMLFLWRNHGAFSCNHSIRCSSCSFASEAEIIFFPFLSTSTSLPHHPQRYPPREITFPCSWQPQKSVTLSTTDTLVLGSGASLLSSASSPHSSPLLFVFPASLASIYPESYKVWAGASQLPETQPRQLRTEALPGMCLTQPRPPRLGVRGQIHMQNVEHCDHLGM